jgi:hypothetical protein
MTARWSGVARGRVERPSALTLRQAITQSNVGGFPTTLGRRAPEVVFRQRVLVT